MKKPINITVSELILSAVYFLQRKNGVSVKDITKYICEKRGFKQSRMKDKVKEALDRGTRNGIFNLKRGLYKVEADYKKKLTNLKKKVKKKSQVKKSKKKLPKKVSKEEIMAEEDKPVPFASAKDEDTGKSMVFKTQVGNHSMSEDVFARGERENSYFEPSALTRASDEEYFFEDDDEEEDDEDDDYSETNENGNMDIYTITTGNEPSENQFPEFDIYNAAKQAKRRRLSERNEKDRNRNGKRNRNAKGKKRKLSKPRKKSRGREERKKPRVIESDDDDFFDEEESDYSGESDFEKPKPKPKQKPKVTIRQDLKPNEEKLKAKHEEPKKNKGIKEGKGTEEPKGVKENKDGKEVKEKNLIKAVTKNKEKQGSAKDSQKHKKQKRPTSEECRADENQDNLLTKSEVSPMKSECLITSSTKLLPSDLKLSISSNLIVSDLKFSPTNIKSETQDSITFLFTEKMRKKQSRQQQQKEPKSPKQELDDFAYYCECKSYKRKNPASFSYRDNDTPLRDGESTQGRTKFKRSQK